jgi:hypothetical protein
MRELTLKQKLKFASGSQRVLLHPVGAPHNSKWYEYALYINDSNGIGELCFNEYGAIVNCRYFKNDPARRLCNTMNLSEFKERFHEAIKKIVPKEIYKEHLAALDMGEEGVFSQGRPYLRR